MNNLRRLIKVQSQHLNSVKLKSIIVHRKLRYVLLYQSYGNFSISISSIGVKLWTELSQISTLFDQIGLRCLRSLPVLDTIHGHLTEIVYRVRDVNITYLKYFPDRYQLDLLKLWVSSHRVLMLLIIFLITGSPRSFHPHSIMNHSSLKLHQRLSVF